MRIAAYLGCPESGESTWITVVFALITYVTLGIRTVLGYPHDLVGLASETDGLQPKAKRVS